MTDDDNTLDQIYQKLNGPWMEKLSDTSWWDAYEAWKAGDIQSVLLALPDEERKKLNVRHE